MLSFPVIHRFTGNQLTLTELYTENTAPGVYCNLKEIEVTIVYMYREFNLVSYESHKTINIVIHVYPRTN